MLSGYNTLKCRKKILFDTELEQSKNRSHTQHSNTALLSVWEQVMELKSIYFLMDTDSVWLLTITTTQPKLKLESS